MTYDIVMPQLGLTMEEGAVVCWQKQIGDWVEKGETLFVVETDKAEMDVESSNAGYLNSIRVEAKKKVRVGTVIAVLGDQRGEGASSPAAAEGAPVLVATPLLAAEDRKPAPEPISPEQQDSGDKSAATDTAALREFPASPRARRLARELEIDLKTVKPARGERIVEEDVRRAHQAQQAPVAAGQAARPRDVSERATTTRKIIAQRMTQSFQSAPHFYLGVEANAAEMVKARAQLLDTFQQQTGFKLSYTDLLLRALTLSLAEHGEVNSFWQNGGVQPRDSIDVGFAVQTPEGLLVPVVRGADRLGFFELARQRHLLTQKAGAGTLTLAEMEGGSATLTNLGNSAIDWFQAILNPPQSVILATGRIANRAVVVNEHVEVCPTVMLSLAVDHRVLDGAAGAKFLGRIKELIESPSLMLR